VPRSSFYYRPRDRTIVIDDVLAQRINHLIDAEPYLGYRMVWARLRQQGLSVNRKAIQRLMQLKGWQCHRRLKKRCSPRVESSPSVALVSNVRWAADATYVWTRLDGLIYVNAVLDCADRECVGLNVSQRNDAREAAWALEDALLRRFGALPQGDANVPTNRQRPRLCIRTLWRSRSVIRLSQEFILPHTPEQNGVVESFMGTLKLECIWQTRFDTYAQAKAAITAWVKHYNESRPHSRLGYLPRVEWRRRQAEISA
jgi:putative transposase